MEEKKRNAIEGELVARLQPAMTLAPLNGKVCGPSSFAPSLLAAKWNSVNICITSFMAEYFLIDTMNLVSGASNLLPLEKLIFPVTAAQP